MSLETNIKTASYSRDNYQRLHSEREKNQVICNALEGDRKNGERDSGKSKKILLSFNYDILLKQGHNYKSKWQIHENGVFNMYGKMLNLPCNT